MKRALPFAVLAAVGLLAWATAPQAKFTAAAPGLSAVSMDAALEQTHLMANERGETFLRVALVGAPVALKDRLPMNAVVVIDRSGSMGGRGPTGTEKMHDAREAAKFLVSQLQNGDKVAVVSFDNGAEVLSESRVIGPGAYEAIASRIDTLRARGGTDMIAGLTTGLDQARALFGRNQVNRIILISDGRPNSADGLDGIARQAARKGITVTTMGVGTDYNEDLMSTIADAGQGNYYFINDSARMAAIFEQELKSMMAVVAREAVIKIALQNGVKVEEVFGYEASIGRDVAAIPVGDIYGGRHIEVLARLSFPAQRGDTELVKVSVAFHDALANAGRQLDTTVAASFVTDKNTVTASLNKEVAEKVEKVKIANAMQQAMVEYKAGRADKARQIVREQNVSTANRNAVLGSSALAGEADALTELEATISGAAPAATQSAVQKKAKQRARTLAR